MYKCVNIAKKCVIGLGCTLFGIFNESGAGIGKTAHAAELTGREESCRSLFWCGPLRWRWL